MTLRSATKRLEDSAASGTSVMASAVEQYSTALHNARSDITEAADQVKGTVTSVLSSFTASIERLGSEAECTAVKYRREIEMTHEKSVAYEEHLKNSLLDLTTQAGHLSFDIEKTRYTIKQLDTVVNALRDLDGTARVSFAVGWALLTIGVLLLALNQEVPAWPKALLVLGGFATVFGVGVKART